MSESWKQEAEKAIAAATPEWCTGDAVRGRLFAAGRGLEIAIFQGDNKEANTNFAVIARTALPLALKKMDEKDAELARKDLMLELASYSGHYISVECQRGRHEHCVNFAPWTWEPCLCKCSHTLDESIPKPTLAGVEISESLAIELLMGYIASKDEEIAELKAQNEESRAFFVETDKQRRCALSENQALRAEVERLDGVLGVIERICGDDFCEELDMQEAFHSEDLTAEMKTAHAKLSAVYRASHSAVKTHRCFHVHGDWRAEVIAALSPAAQPPDANDVNHPDYDPTDYFEPPTVRNEVI